jgi:hypothetical protein
MLTTAGCSHLAAATRWSVQSVSADGRVVHLAVDVSCGAKITSSYAREYHDRVSIVVDTSGGGGSCSAVLTLHDLAIRLRSPIGTRWVDGACVGGCLTDPNPAPLRCALTPPFGFGFLPSGWQTATNTKAQTTAAYQSPNGQMTIELRQNAPDSKQQSTDRDLFVLGDSVPLETVQGGFAVTVDLTGKGTACGRWLLVGHGTDESTFTAVAEQLFPR